jgi:hypothetical protein
MRGAIPPFPKYAFMAWCLIKHRDNLTFFLSSFLGSTAQLRPWPPPQNPAEFLGGFSTISFLQGRVVSPTPKQLYLTLGKQSGEVWTAFIWLTIGTNGGIL